MCSCDKGEEYEAESGFETKQNQQENPQNCLFLLFSSLSAGEKKNK